MIDASVVNRGLKPSTVPCNDIWKFPKMKGTPNYPKLDPFSDTLQGFGDPSFYATAVCDCTGPPVALAGSHGAGRGCSSGVSVSQNCTWAALGRSLSEVQCGAPLVFLVLNAGNGWEWGNGIIIDT